LDIHEDFQQIDIRNFSTNESLSDYLEIEAIVPLETSEQSSLRDVDKIFTFNDTLLIIDLKSMAFKLFDPNGEFLNQIGIIGQGPGEYIYASDASLSYDQQDLWVNDLGGNKFIRYSLNGEVLEEIRRQVRVYFFLPTLDKEWVVFLNYYSPSATTLNCNFFILDEELTVRNPHFPVPPDLDVMYRDCGYMSLPYNGEILINESFSDTIFSWQNGRMRRKYILKFNDSPSELKLGEDNLIYEEMQEGSLRAPIFEGDRFLSFRYGYKGRLRAAFWHKPSQKLLTDESFEHGDILLHLFPPKGITDEGLYIGAIVPGWFYTYLMEEDPGMLPYLQEHFPQLYEVSVNMKDSDNPVIFFYRMK